MTDPRKDKKAMRGAENRRAEQRARVRDDFALIFAQSLLSNTNIKFDPQASDFAKADLEVHELGRLIGRLAYRFADGAIKLRGEP